MTTYLLQSITSFLYTTTRLQVSFCWQFWLYTPLYNPFSFNHTLIIFLDTVVGLFWQTSCGARQSLFTISCTLQHSRSPIWRGRSDFRRFSSDPVHWNLPVTQLTEGKDLFTLREMSDTSSPFKKKLRWFFSYVMKFLDVLAPFC